MRLVSVGAPNFGAAGVVLGDRVADAGEMLGLSGPVTMLDLIRRGNGVVEDLRSANIDRIALRPLDTVDVGPPVPNPRKVIAIGLNYADHASEAKFSAPAEPLVFAKFPSAIVGPGASIEWNRELTGALDYEAELAVVIGAAARRVSAASALEHVFGYTCLNDITARDLQERDGQWVRAKSLDTFCPMGPSLVSADEIPDPQSLRILCTVAGEKRQDASTKDMLFGVADLIARLSAAFTLEPGDIIATGTPPGVGWFADPIKLLAHGDEVVVTIEGIGQLRNRVVVRGMGPVTAA